MPRTTQSRTINRLVGEQVRARRKDLRLTQAEVADRLSVSATYIQKVEAGTGNLTLGQLERVLAALDAYPSVVVVPVQRPVTELAAEPGVTGRAVAHLGSSDRRAWVGSRRLDATTIKSPLERP